MWQALNPPQLQAPLFGPCLLFAVGILVFELPHEPLALAVGVLLIAKPKRLVMVLFIGLGMARIALHIHQYPRNQTKECSLWNCSSADVLKDQTFQCHCSSLKYPTGIEVEWNHGGQTQKLIEVEEIRQNLINIAFPIGQISNRQNCIHSIVATAIDGFHIETIQLENTKDVSVFNDALREAYSVVPHVICLLIKREAVESCQVHDRWYKSFGLDTSPAPKKLQKGLPFFIFRT